MTLKQVVDAFTQAMERMQVNYYRTKSRSSNSTYFRLKYKNQVNRVYVRIATHELTRDPTADDATPWEGSINIQIGKKPWAEYEFDDWYMCLEKVANMFPCQETKAMSRKIIAEEKLRRTPLPDSLQRTLDARRKKVLAVREDKRRRYEAKIKELTERHKKKKQQETMV